MQGGKADIELIGQIKSNDFEAFRILFERYYNSLCNFASSFFTDDFLREDVVQEVFTKVWEDRHKLRINESVKSYLYTAVRNKSMNRLKSESVRRQYTSNFTKTLNTHVSEAEIEQEEFRNYLYQCIEKLPARCREVFEKSRFEDMKQEKIAISLDISIKTVKAQISKALQMIRGCLQQSYPEYL